MRSDHWIKTKLSFLIDTISETYKFRSDTKVVLINTSDILEGKVNNHLKIFPENVAGQFKKTFRKNDILYSEIRPANKRYAYIDFESKNYVASTKLMVLRKKNELVDNQFIYQLLKSNDTLSKLQVIAESRSGTFPQITFTELSNLEINLPSLKEQKAIANILSSLDDKIELNNKINKNLENLAQTFYKRWFVDFEFPNENGEPYKSSGGEMIESELGLIPKGWSVLTLDELVVKSSTKTNPDSNQKLIDMANMPSYSITLNSFDNGDKLSTNTYRMKKFSFLYGSIRPYLGKFGIAPFDGITTGTIHNFNVKDNFDYSLVATTVFSTKFNEFCIKLSHGTKMPTIKWDDFVSYIVIYSDEVSYKFNKIVRVMFEQIVNNVSENVKLSKIRDELLPKLMNGEIEVPIEE